MKSPFSHPVQAAVVVARRAGKLIAERRWPTDLELKESIEFGTSSVAAADKLAEAWIIKELSRFVPRSYFLGEESAKKLELSTLLAAQHAFIIDPRDGTTEDSHELSFWCVSIGVLKCGSFIGGVVFAPEGRGGLLTASEKGVGD